MTFDSTVHLGDAITTGVLAGIAWMLQRSIRSVTAFIKRVDNFDGRIEITAEVVDLHSDVLRKAGMGHPLDLQPVSRRRRRSDPEFMG